jgi:hypothetical protein
MTAMALAPWSGADTRLLLACAGALAAIIGLPLFFEVVSVVGLVMIGALWWAVG